MSGTLYVVATPLGNLSDLSPRAAETLCRVNTVAAEDTRRSRTLLEHVKSEAALMSFHAHSSDATLQKILHLLGTGKDVALVTDAGTPAVSDPGAKLVEAVRAAGHRVIPVPGASALTAALSASGVSHDGVIFAGFLPAKGRERREKLAALAAGSWAIALFEAPHRIGATLADLHAALGERDVVIAREITKKFEAITRLPLSQARDWVAADSDRGRGEIVLVIEGREPERASATDPRAVLEALLAELPLKQAVALAVKLTGEKRNALYALALALKK